ncbi:hypothetical protein LIER_38941 [Lithospermum erythrorhizon]|uniref:Uncharacterized protein n=1 Tax=Lithospermum erythrorhizon TaxID=34254 RepID=A0AAV3QBN2_LITER
MPYTLNTFCSNLISINPVLLKDDPVSSLPYLVDSNCDTKSVQPALETLTHALICYPSNFLQLVLGKMKFSKVHKNLSPHHSCNWALKEEVLMTFIVLIETATFGFHNLPNMQSVPNRKPPQHH